MDVEYIAAVGTIASSVVMAISVIVTLTLALKSYSKSFEICPIKKDNGDIELKILNMSHCPISINSIGLFYLQSYHSIKITDADVIKEGDEKTYLISSGEMDEATKSLSRFVLLEQERSWAYKLRKKFLKSTNLYDKHLPFVFKWSFLVSGQIYVSHVWISAMQFIGADRTKWKQMESTYHSRKLQSVDLTKYPWNWTLIMIFVLFLMAVNPYISMAGLIIVCIIEGTYVYDAGTRGAYSNSFYKFNFVFIMSIIWAMIIDILGVSLGTLSVCIFITIFSSFPIYAMICFHAGRLTSFHID